jgi:hypothetical protein
LPRRGRQAQRPSARLSRPTSKWRNGRRASLRGWCPLGRAGSSPAFDTTQWESSHISGVQVPQPHGSLSDGPEPPDDGQLCPPADTAQPSPRNFLTAIAPPESSSTGLAMTPTAPPVRARAGSARARSTAIQSLPIRGALMTPSTPNELPPSPLRALRGPEQVTAPLAVALRTLDRGRLHAPAVIELLNWEPGTSLEADVSRPHRQYSPRDLRCHRFSFPWSLRLVTISTKRRLLAGVDKAQNHHCHSVKSHLYSAATVTVGG